VDPAQSFFNSSANSRGEIEKVSRPWIRVIVFRPALILGVSRIGESVPFLSCQSLGLRRGRLQAKRQWQEGSIEEVEERKKRRRRRRRRRTHLTTPPTLTLQTTPPLNFPRISSFDILVPGSGFLTPQALPNSSSRR